jgi:hypothetical protein
MFTLKIKKVDNCYFVSDDKHASGGIDINQRKAFKHLIPEEFVDALLIDTLFFLAKLHNREVEVTNK